MEKRGAHQIPEWAFEFHGHRCPAMPIGYLAGKYALQLLGIDRESDTNTYVFSETGDDHHQGCFDDGVQAATGCTYGKGNYKRLQYGKMAIIVYKPGKGAVRIRPKPEILEGCSTFEFFKYRKSGIPASQVPRNVSNEVINYVISKDFEQLFYYDFLDDFTYYPPKKTMARVTCDSCNEPTYENYIKIFNGRKLCYKCYEKERNKR